MAGSELIPADPFPVRIPILGAETVLPTLAAPVTLTSGAANTFGSYATIGTLPAGEEAILSEILMVFTSIDTGTAAGIVELRHSSATTFEIVPAANFQQDTTPANWAGSAHLSYKLAPQKVPAAALIEARFRTSRATQTLDMWLTYWKQSQYPRGRALQSARAILSGNELGVGVWTPVLTGNGTTVVSGGSAWTFGSWTTLIASANAGLLDGLHITYVVSLLTGRSIQIEIGIGSAGNEIAVYRTGFLVGRTKNLGITPPILLKAGDRVSLRVAASSASSLNQYYVHTNDFV